MKNNEDRKKLWLKEYLPLSIKSNFSPVIQKALQKIPYPKEVENMEDVKSVYIHGPRGTGKTIRASFLLLQELRNNFIKRHGGCKCIFITVPELLLKFKNSYHPQFKKVQEQETELEILDKFSNVDLLVLDDIGAEKTTDWSFQMLYILINRRYENMMKTIFTSNLSLEQLAEKLQDDRISSRIQGMCEIVKMSGKDFRTKK